MEIKRYDDYIDSREAWLGQVPLDWTMVLISQLVTPVKNKNIDLKEQNLLSLSYGKIKRKSIDSSGGLLPESFDGYNIIETNDIVLRLTDLQNDHTSLRVGLATERGIITSAYTTLRPKNPKSAKFLYYLIHSFDIRKGFYGMGSGVRQGLNYDEVKKLKLPIPSVGEQEAIADYLDSEIVRIDSIISEAKASIEEYKAWKASIIYEAVTKGLDPNVEMKDSGVEWIGKIPVGWNVQKLKTLVEEPLQYGANEAGIEYDESLPRYIRITDVTANGELKEEGKLSLSEDIAADYILNDGDILLARSGGTVGKAFYYKAEYGRAAFAGYMIRAKINRKKIDPKLVYFSTLSANYDDWKATSMTQATIQNIGANKYNEFYIVVPPIEKQAELVSYLEEKVVQIDNLIVEKESLINDLESYKKSLIFEVVTGKRKVV